MTKRYIDACSLLNLCATRRLDKIVQDLQLEIVVLPLVYPGESAYLFTRTDSGERGDKEKLLLEPFFERNTLLKEKDPTTEEEIERYVLYATLMDDGEAATLAAAECRAGRIITDDFGAWKVAANHTPQVPVNTTLHLLKEWMKTGVTAKEIIEVIEEIEIRARYVPSRRHPLFEWFNSLRSTLP